MAWNPFNYVGGAIDTEVNEGDLISVDFTGLVQEPFDVTKGPMQAVVPVVSIEGPVVWKNMVTEIERDLAVIIPTLNGIRKAPMYQEFRSQSYGPYMVNKDTMGVSFIYADAYEGVARIDSSSLDPDENDNQEERFPPDGIKVNDSNSNHLPLAVQGLGFIVGIELDQESQIKVIKLVKRLVLKHKSYVGSACDIVTGMDIIALKGARRITVDAMILY